VCRRHQVLPRSAPPHPRRRQGEALAGVRPKNGRRHEITEFEKVRRRRPVFRGGAKAVAGQSGCRQGAAEGPARAAVRMNSPQSTRRNAEREEGKGKIASVPAGIDEKPHCFRRLVCYRPEKAWSLSTSFCQIVF